MVQVERPSLEVRLGAQLGAIDWVSWFLRVDLSTWLLGLLHIMVVGFQKETL